MDSLLKEYHLTKSNSVFSKIEQLLKESTDMVGCIKALTAYSLIHNSNVFGPLIVDALNRISTTSIRELEQVVEKLIHVLDLSDLCKWPTDRQRVKYRMLNGLVLKACDVQYFEEASSSDEAYLQGLGLGKLLRYRNELACSQFYRLVVGRMLMASSDYWEEFKSFPFFDYKSTTSISSSISIINELYFELDIEKVYEIEGKISERVELMRIYLILCERQARYPKWRRHFEWFMFKHSTTLGVPLDPDMQHLQHWDFIMDRIETELPLNAEGPRMLEIALERCPYAASSFQPIIVELVKKRHRSEDFYLLPLLRMLRRGKDDSLVNVLVNYLSLDSLPVRLVAGEMLIGIYGEMLSKNRLPFVARTWDLLVNRKDATVKYLKDLVEMEGDFLESRIAKLPEEKKKYLY